MPEVSWSDLGVALGLVLVIEGALFALFARQMRQIVAAFLESEVRHIRMVALILLITGLSIVWIIRG